MNAACPLSDTLPSAGNVREPFTTVPFDLEAPIELTEADFLPDGPETPRVMIAAVPYETCPTIPTMLPAAAIAHLFSEDFEGVSTR